MEYHPRAAFSGLAGHSCRQGLTGHRPVGEACEFLVCGVFVRRRRQAGNSQQMRDLPTLDCVQESFRILGFLMPDSHQCRTTGQWSEHFRGRVDRS